MHPSNVCGAFTAVGFGSGLPKVEGTNCIKDAHAFLFRVVKAGVVAHLIKCNNKAGQGTPNAVCGGDVGSAAMCGVVLCCLSLTHAWLSLSL